MTRPAHRSIDEALRAAAARDPDKTALLCEDRRLSYRELDRASDRFAGALAAAGLVGPCRVGILARNSDRYVECLCGILKAGATATVLNWRLAVPELAAIVADADIRLLLHEAEFAGMVEQLVPHLPAGTPCLTIDADRPADRSYAHFVTSGAEAAPEIEVAPEADAILMYTSGTTARPKGVPATHFAMLWNFASSAAQGPRCASTAEDVNLLTSPLFHLAGVSWTLAALVSGATLVILPRVDADLIFAAIERHRVTRAVILPPLMPSVLERIEAGADLGSLRHISYGAAPIPEALLARMLDRLCCSFVQNYGMTEISASATILGPDDHYPGSPHLLSCGRPYPDVAIRIAAADGSPCPTGETGEVLIRTPSLMRGYWKQPEATREVIRDGWYASGDLGYLDADGYLYLRDRKKDMIVSGGENIYSAEIESVLSSHPGIARAAVIGVPSARWGEAVKAFVIPNPGAVLSEAAVTEFLRARIAGYKVPKSFEFVAELPVTPLGKIAKHVLRERYWAGHDRRIN